jgi:hypothetical protein
VVVIVWLICGFVSATVAANKGRNGCVGFGLGALFGSFGLIIALVLPPRQARDGQKG